MRRTAILAAAALVACAKTEQPEVADTTTMPAPATISLADVAGTWGGKVMPMGSDSVIATTQLRATADTSGWSMEVKSGTRTSTTTPGRVTVAGDSIIVDSGPFASVVRPGQQVSTYAIYRLQDGKLVGVVHATYANGDTATLRTEATRK